MWHPRQGWPGSLACTAASRSWRTIRLQMIYLGCDGIEESFTMPRIVPLVEETAVSEILFESIKESEDSAAPLSEQPSLSPSPGSLSCSTAVGLRSPHDPGARSHSLFPIRAYPQLLSALSIAFALTF